MMMSAFSACAMFFIWFDRARLETSPASYNRVILEVGSRTNYLCVFRDG